MIAFGFAAKEFIRWNKDGRQTHIFNPSSFTLTIFSLALILTGASDITWGKDIAITQFYPPHMYLFLFLVALPGQFLFGVTTMTMSAVLTTYLFGLAYYAVTGTYYFFDSYIPIAVFLGMHLLFTDPSTSPRTELGRMIFGALYGLSTIALYALLRVAGLPTFYDKLLQVPLLNLLIQSIDRAVRSGPLRRFDPALIGRSLSVRRRNLAYISVWAIVFADHDRCARRGRSSSWPVDSILAASLRAGSRRRVSVSCLSCTRITAARIPAGRATSWAGCRPNKGDGSAGGARVDAAWLRARLSARMRQRRQSDRRQPAGHRTSAARGTSDSLARKQRADHRSECGIAIPARVRPGLARELRPDRQFEQPVG